MNAENINKSCYCKTLDQDLLARELDQHLDLKDRPNLFSSTMFFLSPPQFKKIKILIEAIEKVIGTSSYQNQVLTDAPVFARAPQKAKGVFMGYDFHLEGEEAKLIEINTNAGGALLNAKLIRAHIACCPGQIPETDSENDFIEMFKREWFLEKGNDKLESIAIIDERPSEQYLYPEFKLFQELLTKAGFRTFIADPTDLQMRENKLWLGKERIDLVYNRNTDFYFEDAKTSVLKEAYLTKAALITPNPYHHALYANKLNLEILSSGDKLRELNIPDDQIQILLAGIPKTEKVNSKEAESFWNRRRDLFFKPAKGYGSKASYRGDKITKKVWSEILQTEYVAQKIISPSLRAIKIDDTVTDLKADIRVYVYDGKIQLLTSRLYSGQTTNFRSAGGGFAPVFIA
jgi:hypothetical protein